jgi:hypothetical protein
MDAVTTRSAGHVHYAWVIPGGTSAVGLPVGGYFYDRFGNYMVPFRSAALVAFAATLMVLAIRERPVSRRPPQVVLVAPASGL